MVKVRFQVGDLFILVGALLWSFFPILSAQVITHLSPLLVTGIANLIAATFLSFVITSRFQWKSFSKAALPDVLLTVLFISILAYFLLFSATKFTSPNNVAILGLSQIFWGFLILGCLKMERFTLQAIEGSLLMVLGAGLVLYAGTFSFNPGDWLVIGANACFVTGNIFQKRARQRLSAIQLLFLRSLISGLFCLIVSIGIQGNLNFGITGQDWIILAILGIGIFAIEKICWIEGMHRIPITRANVISAIHPGLTMIWGLVLFREIPTFYQWIGFGLMIAGAYFILLRKDIFKTLKL